MSDSITVQVALRIRPLVESEIHRGCQKCLQTITAENQVQVIGTDKAFTFNNVFDDTVSQEDVYINGVKSMVQKLFRGFNVTILAYGQTGSGKTYSMGTNYDGNGEMGVIPRAIVDIFQYIENHSAEYEFRVTVSFMELYKENLYDLLCDRPREQCVIDIREDLKGIKMPGLTEQLVTTVQETTKCLMNGSLGRATGATAMNAQSSRSHAIFTITIYMAKRGNEDNATTSKFHLVDLAGSERSKKTKATGERFKEGVNINKGLLALGNVISALGEENQKGFISYRDSKLTRLLQDSLGGNSITLMIACVSPADYNLEETISTLRYADRARKIRNKPIVNQDPKAAEIARLNQLVQHLRVQLITDGGGEFITSDKYTEMKEEITQLQNKNRSLNSALSLALTDNTTMFERQLLTQSANERLKKKLLELQDNFNITLSNFNMTIGQVVDCPTDVKEQIEKLHDMKSLITDLQSEHQKNEEELLRHECLTTLPKTSVKNQNFISEPDLDERQETHTKEQLCLNDELQELNRQLALKEQLASQIIANNNHMIDYVALSENESKINILEKEKDELLQQLKGIRSTEVSSKLAEQRRKRVKELETQISDLNRKVVEQARLIKLKEKDEQKIRQLNNEITFMKSNKVKLIKNMRSEEQKFRTWKQQREKDLMKLKDQDRKRQNQIVKMENMHQKQQTVLKRKVEEAVAINKRLKDALALQKMAQERRVQNLGKTERVQNWVSQEFDVMVSTIDAQKSLEHLLESRALVCAQLEDYKKNRDIMDISEDKINELADDLAMRSAQIADFQQKIIDSDQDNMSKARWETIQSMVDAKCALKHLFDLAADMRRKFLTTEYKFEDLSSAHKETIEKLSEYEQKLKEQNHIHDQQISQVVKDNEEKVSVLLKQLRGIKTCSEDESLLERLRIQEQALEKMDALRLDVEQYQEKVHVLQEKLNTVHSVSQKGQMNKSKKPRVTDETYIMDYAVEDTSIEVDEDDKDPDWSKTPIYKRVLVTKSKASLQNKDRQTVKRTSDGSTKCACKGSCCTKLCGCKKLQLACTDLCKCINCNNKDESQPDKPVKKLFSDTDSEDSFKKPKILCEHNYEETFTAIRKRKKQYFNNGSNSSKS